MRISITPACNLRCFYCFGPRFPGAGEYELSSDEIIAMADLLVGMGIHSVKITGGEPLMRKEAPALITRLSGIPGLRDLSLTTNGVLLARTAEKLKEAGLKRVNISLDTLRRDRFLKITGSDELNAVLKGIRSARQYGLSPIKINTIILRGINDDEIHDFVRFASDEGLIVRFIELMPADNRIRNWRDRFMGKTEIQSGIQNLGALTLLPDGVPVGTGPAEYFTVAGYRGIMGFISSVSAPFCPRCNRIRIDAGGNLIPCLFGENSINLRELMMRLPREQIVSAIHDALSRKGVHHGLSHMPDGDSRLPSMCRTGG